MAMPDYIAGLMEFLGRRYPDLFGEQSQIMRHLSGAETMLRDGGLTVLNQVLVGSLKLLDFLILLVVTPVVTFYLLLDWDSMVAGDQPDPAPPARPHHPPPRPRDRRGAGGLRARPALGLPDPRRLLRARAHGDRPAVRLPRRAHRRARLLHPLRRARSSASCSRSGSRSSSSGTTKIWVLATAGIFFFGQFVEGNILTPNLIGKSVGLHPVWLILALSVFGIALRLRRPPRRRAGLGGARRPLALPGRALPRERRSTPAACRPRTARLDRAAPARPRPPRPPGPRAGRLLRLALERAGAGAGRGLARLAGRTAGRRRAGGRGQDPSRPCLGGAERGARSSATSPALDLAALPADAALAVEDVDRLAGDRAAEVRSSTSATTSPPAAAA